MCCCKTVEPLVCKYQPADCRYESALILALTDRVKATEDAIAEIREQLAVPSLEDALAGGPDLGGADLGGGELVDDGGLGEPELPEGEPADADASPDPKL